MTINQLKYIITISNSSSMREAAGKLFVSQPALSSAVSELEEELGFEIFTRTSKGISLTPAGNEFLLYAKQAVSQYEIVEDRYLGDEANKEHFDVSSQHYSFAVEAFSKVIKKFDPDTYTFAIHETRTAEVIKHVTEMQSEVGIISFSSQNEKVINKLLKDNKLEFEPIMVCDAYAYVWEDHEFAGRDSISIDELQDYPCISFEQRSDTSYYLSEESLANYNFRKMIKSDDRGSTMELICKLHGYSIGTGLLTGEGELIEGLVSIKLEEEDPLTIGYITRQGAKLSDIAKGYIEELEVIRELNA